MPEIVAFLLTKKSFGYILICYTIIHGFSVVLPFILQGCEAGGG